MMLFFRGLDYQALGTRQFLAAPKGSGEQRTARAVSAGREPT